MALAAPTEQITQQRPCCVVRFANSVVKTGPMAQWNALTEALEEGRTSVRLTWSELDRMVGGLPPSAANHRAWWSGDRPHVRAWRSAGYTVSNLVMGVEVSFVRTGEPDPADRAPIGAPLARPPIHAVSRGRAPHADLVLVACVKTKLDVPAAARDLYISSLFQKERGYAERRGGGDR